MIFILGMKDQLSVPLCVLDNNLAKKKKLGFEMMHHKKSEYLILNLEMCQLIKKKKNRCKHRSNSRGAYW